MASLWPQPLVSIVLVSVVLVLLFLDLLYRDNDRRFLTVVVLFGLTSPLVLLLPLIGAGFVVPRWVFVPSIFVVFYVACFCARLNKPVLVGALYLFVFASSTYAAYQRAVAEEPFFARAKGRSYQAILESGPDSYVVDYGFTQLAAESYSVWTYISLQRPRRALFRGHNDSFM